ncbi:cysteine-rich receptor-like protein kinase 7 isoform X2 [Triticum urartu]|uniref:cysteine-rich receptor-like protein kinase 7 isoform X2 n=1 Tax=Triticum urartu TaxID=4572 RepID=UPI002043127B|nr:cysteine-rich receptor-like protein kinase 7 isoform X2 [Triticum urartu]
MLTLMRRFHFLTRTSTMWNKVDLKSDQPCKLSYQFIKQVTNDYDQELVVGSGTFGTVYKGICENRQEIAVKVLRNIIEIDNKDFQKEFQNLRRLKHQNVVRLLGFCNETEKVLVACNRNQVVADKMHKALVFEYVRNGSLGNHISAHGCSGFIWHIHYKIIKGICLGLNYLQNGFELSIWHLDLKPENILLGKNMIPKIADFGLSRLLGDENTRKTINAVGTRGYLPPEYIDQGPLSKKFDIFSLGVIIAKLMAGTDDYFKAHEMGEKGFVNHVIDKWRKRLRATLTDRPLEVYCEQVRICIQIAVKCMNYEREERPTRQSIVSDLIETETMIGSLGLETEQDRKRWGTGGLLSPHVMHTASRDGKEP